MLFVEFDDFNAIKIKINISKPKPRVGFFAISEPCARGGLSGGSPNEEPQVHFDEFFLEKKYV